MKSNGQAEIVNIIAKIDSQSDFENRNTVKAVTAINNHVLYFSREPIPSKKKEHRDSFGYKQTGIILFKRAALLLFNATPPTPLEIMESCDMLRVLENNGAIAVIKSERPFFAVDIPGDIRHVEQALTTITETDLT